MEEMRRSSHSWYHNTHWVIGNDRVVCAAHTKFLSKLILISWLSKDRLMFVNKYWNKMDYWLMALAFTLPSQSQINPISFNMNDMHWATAMEANFRFSEYPEAWTMTKNAPMPVGDWFTDDNPLGIFFHLHFTWTQIKRKVNDDVEENNCRCSNE